MKKAEMVKISREILDGFLSNNTKQFNKKHYFMFVVSKFMALKELMIKKNSESNTIVFDDITFQDKIGYLIALTWLVKNNGSYTIDKNLKVELESGDKDSPLIECVWVFNKIRDSIAHGRFDFDLESDCIIINNDQISNPQNGYRLVCKLPIRVLDQYTFAVTNDIISKDLKKDKVIKLYGSYIKRDMLSNLYKFHTKSYDGTFPKEIYSGIVAQLLDIRENIIKNKSSEETCELIDSIINKCENINLNSSTNSKDTQELIDTLQLLKSAVEVESTKDNMGVINTINELRQILENSNKGSRRTSTIDKTTDEMAVLLNYMIMLFQNTEGMSTPFLKTKFTSKDNELISIDFRVKNNGYEEQRRKTKDLIKNYIKKTSKFLDIIYEMEETGKPTSEFAATIRNAYIQFYENAISMLQQRNEFITTGLRNSSEHVRIESTDGHIHLWDVADNTKDSKSLISFDMKCSMNDLSEFLRYNYETEEDRIFTDEDFMYEICSYIDDPELENNFKSIMRRYQIFIQKSLLKSLKSLDEQDLEGPKL